MTGQNIIDTFHTYIGDTSNLSTAEELILVNKCLRTIYNILPWEFLKKPATGTVTTAGGVSYITLPTDFKHLAVNKNYTENNYSDDNNMANRVIYIGTNYKPYKVINFSDRRNYRNQDGYAYLDLAAGKLYFTYTPSETSYEFDYIYSPADITVATSPLFNSDYHWIVPHLMAVDSTIMDLFDKARSYAKENNSKYLEGLAQLRYLNSQYLNN